MRQGEIALGASWRGNPHGGVKAPPPILLPRAPELFSRRAARLDALAPDHPIEPWLRFVAELARAQVAAFVDVPALNPAVVATAVNAGLPPLAAVGHRRAPSWRDGLRKLLAVFDFDRAPPEAKAAASRVSLASDAGLEADAGAVLRDGASDAAEAVFVVAALQAYFAACAAALSVETLKLLPERGLCPCCGSTPVAAIVTASGDAPGVRYLHCSLCATAWTYTRAVCTGCGEAKALSLKGVEGDAGLARAETCGACRSYAKLLYAGKAPGVEPVADDLATLGLDLLVSEAGFSRGSPNPFLR